MMDPSAAHPHLRAPPSLPLGPGFDTLLQGDDFDPTTTAAASSPLTHWANQQPLMAELGQMHAASAAIQADAACKNAAMVQMVQQLWAQIAVLQNKVLELEDWKRFALDEMSKLRFEHKLLRKRLGNEGEEGRHPATVQKAKSALGHGNSYSDLIHEPVGATPANASATPNVFDTPATTPAKGKKAKASLPLPSPMGPPPGLGSAMATPQGKSVRFSPAGAASPPAASSTAPAAAATAMPGAFAGATAAGAAATPNANTSNSAAASSAATPSAASSAARPPAGSVGSLASLEAAGPSASPAASFASSPDQAEASLPRTLSAHSVASSPDTAYADDGVAEGVHVSSAIVDGLDAEIAFWRITHLSQKLKGRIGRALVSGPFAMLGLEDLRLMIFSDGKDPSKGPRSRRQKELYTKMVTEGPLEGCLKLKVPECPAPHVLEYFLKVGSCRKGPFRHDFSESTVHGCMDFGVDWLTEVDVDQSLTVTLEVLKGGSAAAAS